jgi:CheY-like chemotaxis protein
MEEDLQRAQRLESIGLLAGGIAHDFNNLLQALLGNLSLCLLYIDKEDKAYEKLVAAEKAAFRTKDLTQQLLTFSKGGTPIKKTLAIKALIKETTSFALLGSNINCKYNIFDDLWLVDVDEGQLGQVLQNLTINADHAMPEGGIITVLAKNIFLKEGELPRLTGERYVMISVKDKGTGILKDHLPIIFDPYFSTKQKGSGLGLAVSYSIIKNHDGLLTVESDVGQGSEFFIYLPASQTQDLDQSESSKLANKGEGKILIMDDDVSVLSVAVEMLEYLGYDVDTASDGNKAIDSYNESIKAGHPYNLVILDLTVPGGMGGKETIKKLNELDSNVKAVVSSGYASDPIMANYRDYGFRGVMEKPYTIDQLSSVLAKLLQ